MIRKSKILFDKEISQIYAKEAGIALMELLYWLLLFLWEG